MAGCEHFLAHSWGEVSVLQNLTMSWTGYDRLTEEVFLLMIRITTRKAQLLSSRESSEANGCYTALLQMLVQVKCGIDLG